MSDAPEKIFARYVRMQDGEWLAQHCASSAPLRNHTAYRRDDLPPTLEAAMQLPEVRSLVEAATQFAKSAMSGSDLGWPLVNLDAALAPFTEASA